MPKSKYQLTYLWPRYRTTNKIYNTDKQIRKKYKKCTMVQESNNSKKIKIHKDVILISKVKNSF